jgi:hypothetical protein
MLYGESRTEALRANRLERARLYSWGHTAFLEALSR